MALSWDEPKRQATLAQRNLDFADAAAIIEGVKFQFAGGRSNYGETRITTIGLLAGRMMVMVWTRRGDDQHIISMRKANDREQRRTQDRMG